MSNKDSYDHPEHYKSGNIECIDALKEILSKDQLEGFYHGNCIKYLWRWKTKGGLLDLQKCKWYLDELISLIEK